MFEELTEKKKRLDAQRPLSKTIVNNLKQWFKVELTYSSNALEGNTLTRQETALVVEKGLTVGGKSLHEHLEASNHAQAMDVMYDWINLQPKDFCENKLLALHAMILKGIDDDNAGRYRNVAVRISGSQVILPNYAKIPILMDELFAWFGLFTGYHPVEFAALAHYKLVTIHPFTDGNGRTARLLMNLFLLMQGYPLAIIAKEQRLDYLNALEKAQLGGGMDDYMSLIKKACESSLDIYLDALANSA